MGLHPGLQEMCPTAHSPSHSAAIPAMHARSVPIFQVFGVGARLGSGCDGLAGLCTDPKRSLNSTTFVTDARTLPAATTRYGTRWGKCAYGAIKGNPIMQGNPTIKGGPCSQDPGTLGPPSWAPRNVSVRTLTLSFGSHRGEGRAIRAHISSIWGRGKARKRLRRSGGALQ